MTGDRIPLFCRAKIVKKSAKELEALVEKVAQPTVDVTKMSSTIFEKRPAHPGERPRLFSTKRLKSIAHKLLRSEILELSEDPPFSTIPCQEAPNKGSSLNPSTSESLLKEEVDSAPKMRSGYSENFLKLPYTLPGGF
ncbi:hypothetical protein LIER_25668 [Lithospermum erythrorhizon]|uniref:Uncharacterized protein n=1 Tax=Lithospermum erythrorhizon TaxID=34254 RepID=A0AAV3R5L6_LITER